jgi:hypothetical protein
VSNRLPGSAFLLLVQHSTAAHQHNSVSCHANVHTDMYPSHPQSAALSSFKHCSNLTGMQVAAAAGQAGLSCRMHQGLTVSSENGLGDQPFHHCTLTEHAVLSVTVTL